MGTKINKLPNYNKKPNYYPQRMTCWCGIGTKPIWAYLHNDEWVCEMCGIRINGKTGSTIKR